ncbi:MAG: aspartate--tRNA ligase [Chloroflexi bacterium HGW-Chloroflexi-1]|nr:MAG: aspartate--tRNA ligase [Chloroflexi bacterium HGW-Chloroflexi-1]
MLKTHNCGDLRVADVGETVTLAGWVHRRRDHGALIFLDLRDRSGLVQVTCNAQGTPAAHAVLNTVRGEYVIQVQGGVRDRPAGLTNPNLPTGEIEVVAESAQILNEAHTPPFYINEDVEIDEALRLKYRYLDLRRPVMQQNIILRHQVVSFIRKFLDGRDFLEIETPMLIKTTPEGARDYVVPSRVHPGSFYALPQSPQQLKQLLMVAGYERYFQIARCFRDEDLRADRQPEFTQLDLEMSFVDREDVMALIESLYIALIEALGSKPILAKPFLVLTYAEAMARYGSDKPDLRFGMELVDLGDLSGGSEFKVFSEALAAGGQVKAIVAPGCADFSRRQLDDLGEQVKRFGAKGLVWIARKGDGSVKSAAARFLSESELAAIFERTGAGLGDLVLIVAAANRSVIARSLGELRLALGQQLGLVRRDVHALCWVVEFPLLEWSEQGGRWTAMHHPFTSAMDEDWPLLESDPGRVRAKAYDLVMDGWEVGGGSIRIHRRDRQQAMFRALGIGPEEAEEKFGHLLEAFEFGAPPHGGIATGIDRTVAILAGTTSIREVIAFPKTASATDLMFRSPSEISEAQLRELHLSITA